MGKGKDSGRYTAMEGIRPLAAGDPARIGPYPLLGRLGAGGMGRVYLARSAGGRTVAVKVVHEEHIANGEFRARFRREIEAARRVGGRYTAPVLDADADAERPWVATGYVPGPSLEQAVREHGPLPAASVNALAEGLLRALRGIHAAGIVHRDLKPSNVLLTADGPRVIDFGIARALQVSVESLLTSTGMIIGSPGFMAPEQILGEETGAGADVFSLGCVLMYAATGRLPFGAGASNQHAVMFRIVQSPPDLDAVEDASLRELIERCLVKNAAERPGVEALLEGLTPDPSSDAPRGAWLPPVLLARLAQQSALLLDADVPEARADEPEASDVPAAVDVPEKAESAGAGDGVEPASPVVPEPREPEPRDLGTVDLRPAPVTGDEAGGSSPAPDPAPSPAPEPARAAAPADPAVPDVPGAGDRPRSRRRRRAWVVAAAVVAVLAAGGTTAFLNRDPGGADARGGEAAAPPRASDGPSGDPAAPAGKDDGEDGEDGSKGSGKDKGREKDKEGTDKGQGGEDGGGDSGGGQDAGSDDGSASGGGSSATEGSGASGGGGTGGDGSSGSGGSGGAAKPPATDPDPAPDGRVPQHFVGTWSLASQYVVLQPHTVVIRRVSPGQSAVTLIADVQGSGHCEYTAKLSSVADGGNRINVGTAVVDKARSGAMCRDTDASFFTVAGSGILHDVGPAHASGYRYNRA
ncbi:MULTISPECIES: serine/threonine-protein kinase [unclassified Streptomyces]|uniref:serine/threonine-protein kinase n=1 Tax=unclassified Streptomyces TaxID=2593676 RepID=UPI000B50B0D5|nr:MULTISPECIES: serine/threonine-protein kinase [unclassified Streptomyces]MYW99832.1 protein kinase [Streptomyces sp. SID8378]PVC99602.1 serine/threonine protein kinase [Streptomyces sp. CS147]SNB89798.1 Serine/threonine protein kinase [Streptomyces sp. PgraA7]